MSLETILTRLEGKSSIIGHGHPLAVIGEKINPTGKKILTEELLEGDFSKVREYARKRVFQLMLSMSM